ncbi:hypothetical protein AAG906_030834 [Vitis piasezkii]
MGREKSLVCFKCKKPGHIKYDCSLYKSEAKRRMKKTMMATWSESEESSKEENEREVENMCFMAIDELDEGSKKDKWFLDSGCSRHMTGDESKFAFLTKKKRGYCMHSDFEMSMMGELKFFLGLQIKQLKEGTFINQAKYIRDLLKRFNISSIKHDKDEKSKSINSTMYRGTIGSLLYLTSSRPDIIVVKRILRYLKGTMDIVKPINRVDQAVNRTKTGRPIHRDWGFKETPARRFLHCFRLDFLEDWRLRFQFWTTLSSSSFYSRATYGIGGPIISTVRGVKIRLDPKSIYRIFYIAPVGLRVYKSKIWPIVLGFEPKKVSYYEAFLVDSILIGSWIHLGKETTSISPGTGTGASRSRGGTLSALAWRIAWISIKLVSPLSLSICSRDLSESQHEEMMAYLHSVFPLPPPQP